MTRPDDRGPWTCPWCGEVMRMPYLRGSPKYCVQCGARLRRGPPIPREHHREAPTKATIDTLAAIFDMPHAAGRRMAIALLDEMIAADLDREIMGLVGGSEVTREGIILALARRLEIPTARMIRDMPRDARWP